MKEEKKFKDERCESGLQDLLNALKCLNKLVKEKTDTLTVSQWAEKLNINCHTLYSRIRRNWSIKKVLTFNLKK